jgi:hypothetical protein
MFSHPQQESPLATKWLHDWHGLFYDPSICNQEVAFMEDRIEKQIEIAAPVSRVWQALTDSRQFGEWFLVKMDGPFVAGQPVAGQITHPGYEHVRMEIVVKAIEPETLFSYTWHPYAVDPKGGLLAGGADAGGVSAEATAGGLC